MTYLLGMHSLANDNILFVISREQTSKSSLWNWFKSVDEDNALKQS